MRWIKWLKDGVFRGWQLVNKDGVVQKEVLSKIENLTPDGKEWNDGEVPVLPDGYEHPEDFLNELHRFRRDAGPIVDELVEEGEETFAEANDFDVDDPEDDMPISPHETIVDPLTGQETTAADILKDDTDYSKMEFDDPTKSGEETEPGQPEVGEKQKSAATHAKQQPSDTEKLAAVLADALAAHNQKE